VLAYVPSTGECHVLATGIPFANGVGVSKDRTHLIVAATSHYSLYKVPTMQGTSSPPRALTLPELEHFYAGHLVGMPDGVTVDAEDGSVYVPVFGPLPPALRMIDAAPGWVRRVLIAMPYGLRPSSASVYTMIVHLDADGKVRRVWHDTLHRFGLLTSTARCGRWLYCGSVEGNHVVRVDVGGD
jgi:SMP-30/Gluconolactonase/LRE-like region